jgi:hypothetical protein
VIVSARPIMILLLFSSPGLSSLVIDEVEDTGVVLRLRARTSIPKGRARVVQPRMPKYAAEAIDAVDRAVVATDRSIRWRGSGES